jgi:hypothetical protein
LELSGSLKEFGLAGLLQVVENERKTGLLKVVNGERSGSIFVEEGKIVHASLGNLSGEEAFYRIAFWEDGQFSFHTGEAPTERTIFRANRAILLESACRADEWRRLTKRIPSVDEVPVIGSPKDAGRIHLNTMEWKVLSKINGSRSVKEIAELSEVTEHHAMKVIYDLLEAKVVTLQGEE